MGKVKVVSKNNQVSVKVKSTKDEQLNQNMAETQYITQVKRFSALFTHSSPLFTFYDFGKGINAETLSCQQPKKVKGG